MKGYKNSQNRFYLFDVTIFTRRFDLNHFRYPIVAKNARIAWKEFKSLIPVAFEAKYNLTVTKIFFNHCQVFDLDGNSINFLYKIK